MIDTHMNYFQILKTLQKQIMLRKHLYVDRSLHRAGRRNRDGGTQPHSSSKKKSRRTLRLDETKTGKLNPSDPTDVVAACCAAALRQMSGGAGPVRSARTCPERGGVMARYGVCA